VPIRVELIDEAVEDLARYAESGNLALFLGKLLRLEAIGKEAGQPPGGSLAGWRKIVVGDRNWRIIFTDDPQETVATVAVIGDRADAECYAIAQRRVQALAKSQPEAASLAAAMFRLSQTQRAARRARRRRR